MIDVVLSPGDLGRVEAAGEGEAGAGILQQSQVVVLDVLRATSTMVAALQGGAREVHLYESVAIARAAKVAWRIEGGGGPVFLAGEERCVKPEGFDLGNSPREQVVEKVGGSLVLLATTNGTRTAFRCRQAKAIYAGSLLNAGATAEALLPGLDQMNTVLVCAGTNGALALEDVIGAGAILFALLGATYRPDLAFTDNAWLAYHAFAAVRPRLAAALRLGQGGINLIEAGLEDDIDFCARLDAMPLAVAIESAPFRAIRASERDTGNS